MSVIISDLGYVRLTKMMSVTSPGFGGGRYTGAIDDTGLIGHLERVNQQWRFVLTFPEVGEPWVSVTEARFCTRKSAEIVLRALWRPW